MNTLDIYRTGSLLTTVNIDEKTVMSKKLMSDHKIKTEFILNSPIAFQIGDYITYNSANYYLNRLPEAQKINKQTFKYVCEFESNAYSLLKKRFMYGGLTEFSYAGTPTDFIVLIVGQINQIDTGWSTGDIDTADEQTITFSKSNCSQALTQVAEAFDFEFQITGKTIHLKATVGNATIHRFEYGRSKGLYSLTRLQISDQNIVTRVYGFGGSTNIDSSYRSRAMKTVFASRYLEANVSLYGVIEGEFTDEKIYPRRTGTITAVNNALDSENNWNTGSAYVEDSSLDFDINSYRVTGETAKIVFKSGDLSGYEFEIWKYDHTNKRIYFKPFTESDGYILPNELNLPAVDDTYTLIGIKMPQSYIDAAEAELQTATQAYLDQNSIPQATYKLEIDPRYIKANSISLDTGDLVNIVDTDFGIDSDIRVMDIEFPLVNPNKIKATISDQVVYTTAQLLINTTIQNKQEITNKTAGLTEALRVSEQYQKYAPATPFRGDWDVTKTYTGNKQKVDVVLYNGEYYIAKVDAGDFVGILPTDGSKWNSIGASFESIATALLLAENASIADWTIKDGKITSQTNTTDGTPRAQLDGQNGKITLATDISRYTSSGSNEQIKQTIEVDSQTGFVKVTTSDSETSYINSQGVFTNKAGVQALPASTGIELKAAMVALGFGDLAASAYGDKGALCGIFARASNSNANPAPTYAGYFAGSLLADIFCINPEKWYEVPDTADFQLPSGYTFFVGNNKTADRTYFLPDPADYKKGEIIRYTNYNEYNTALKQLSGDYVNGYDNTQKYVSLFDAGSSVALMSNGSNSWIIVSLSAAGIDPGF